MNENVCCFTGHRDISSDFSRERLIKAIEKKIALGVDTFLNGAAVGFDMIAAFCVLELKERAEYSHIKLHLYIPCKDQDRKWKREDKARYKELLSKSDFIDEPKYGYYDGCMRERNYKMVKNSAHCICYLNSYATGSGQTVREAQRRGLDIINVSNAQ
ncbi:MAG: DUF1273 family protein [Clostridia bacterium]|nr:DUF1273 family protein [Clostridia bacterium]